MTGYLLFCGQSYYPLGGWWDFYGVYPTQEAAKAALPTRKSCHDGQLVDDWEWYHIVDAASGKTVAADGWSCYGDPNTLLNEKGE